MIKELDSSVMVLWDAATVSDVSSPSDAIEFEELKTEFSMQVIVEGTTSGTCTVWLEQSLDGVNFIRLDDDSDVSVTWGSPLICSNIRHFASGNALAKILRAEMNITTGSDAGAKFTVIVAAI